MHSLIVVSHPLPESLTAAVARQIGAGLAQAGHSFEIADLAAEGFDPRFSANDVAVHLRQAQVDPMVAAEQARIGRADALVLVYPVYWWSFPALLKGWIDRVFINGWAYEEMPDGRVVRKLGHLPIHLVAIGGADLRTYARHGYFGAMRTQIDHGIFGYCGAPVRRSELLVPGEARGAAEMLEAGARIGRAIFAPPTSAQAV
ncbi:NAD(P)H-dependent oxidoreductase [Bosea sp. MMO-172]|uniref:NAD(P)H-dependent oxidoreductase n=1 Tax=Bosea sp. MMO-172 TaxID=3127885 RepID=UPI003019A9C2